MRLLIVEDDPLLAIASGLVLAEAGHHIVGVEDKGKEAVERAASTPVDLILTDLQLGDATGGVAVAREAQARCGTAALLLTADPRLAREGRRWALGCLQKPYTPQELIDAVAACERAIEHGPRPGEPLGKLELY